MRIHYFPPLHLLWGFLPGDASSASFLHKFYVRELWRERGLGGRLVVLAWFLLWLPIQLALIGWATSRNGVLIKRRTGRGLSAQLADQLWVAVRYSIPAPWYYIFELHDGEKRRRAGEYLHRYETKQAIYQYLKRHIGDEGNRIFSDKVAFAEACRERDLPAVPLLLAVEEGSFRHLEGDAPSLPAIDLFVKQTYGKGGRGAERWDHRSDGSWIGQDGRVVTESELIEHVRSRPYACVVQPRLVNHCDITDLANGALSTVRITTFRDERGSFEVVSAVLRMAVGSNHVVDNFHAGGIAARVEIQGGVLGRATDLGLSARRGWCDAHPESGAPIAGRKLPFWEPTLALARRAHAAFPRQALVGWDVAITGDGPVLVEANGGPDADIIQRTHEVPVGNARFGELLAYHVERAVEALR